MRQNIDERYHGPQGEARSQAVAQRLAWIPLNLILDDKNFENLRLKAAEEDLAELSESMRYEGLKIPITVIPVPSDDSGFFVRAGFRRLEVARRLRWKGIAAIVLPENTPTIEEYWTNIIENSARSRLSTYEIACAARTMRSKFKTRVSEFATRAGYAPREQILALTRLVSARVVAPATPTRTPTASPSPRLTSRHLRVA